MRRVTIPAPEVSEPVVGAFISWAHAHQSWVPQRADEWRQAVLDFAIALRTVGGIDADLDLWHTASHENWSTFGVTQIRDKDFILVVVSDAYRERWEETGPPHEGAGAAREANAIKAIFERDRQEFHRRVKVILLPGATINDIPEELIASTERFRIASFDLAGMTTLLRSLHGKPQDHKPPLGQVPALPPSYVADVSAATHGSGPGSVQSSSDGADALQRRLSQIDAEISAGSAPSRSYEEELLTRERAVVAGSLSALRRTLARSDEPAPEALDERAVEDELSSACEAAGQAITDAQQSIQRLPAIAREALFQLFHNSQPLTVGGTLDRFGIPDAVRAVENGYLSWVEDAEQTVSPRQPNPRVGAAADALNRARRLAFGGVSWESRAHAAPWARAFLREEYGIDDPEFELRPVWVQLGFLAD